MKRDRTAFDKSLRRHMGLFGSPSANQLEASRQRIRERLLGRPAPTTAAEPHHRRPWRLGLILAVAAAAVVIVIAPWARAYALKSKPVMRIVAAFTKGMIDTSAPLASSVGADQSIPPAIRQAAQPEFEEASIKPCDPENLPPQPEGARGGGANSLMLTPGRLRGLCLTPATLVRVAYGYSPLDLDFADNRPALDFGSVYGMGQEDGRRVRGGPEWIKSERYTIEAVTARGVSPDAHTLSGPMLQRLLERRFQLKVHIESEQTPAFALTVAKGGLKIKPAPSGSCGELPGREGSPMIDGHPASVLTPPKNFADVRRGEKPSCGFWSQRNGPNMVFVAGDVPLRQLAESLGFRLGGIRVIDATNTAARFNFILEFALDENTPGPLRGRNINMPPLPGADNDVPPAATIFSALEDQLGLRLERSSVGREFIVVDRIERPSPN